MPEKESAGKESEFLDVKEAAKFICVSVPFLYQLKATVKDFPFHKIGEKLVFNREELRTWVLNR